jgi:hypothetical protein
MLTSLVFTVAQSKRLIARAVARMPEVKQALAAGMLAIGRGTTNAYVAEEILGRPLLKAQYVAGRTLPPGVPPDLLGRGRLPDIVLKRGQPVKGATLTRAIKMMGPGDVFLKGGNALDYQRRVVGVLVSHPTGGTTGAIYGAVISRKINLILPIGLEKLVCDDIVSLSRESRRAEAHPTAPCPSLFPIVGTIVTEIEALAILCGVKARLLASGGVAGAEGAVWLVLEGEKQALDRALAYHEGLKQEPNLALARAASP